jgi:hypothetical protein
MIRATAMLGFVGYYAPLVFGAVFLVAAIGKIMSLGEFAMVTATFGWLPRGVRGYLPLVIPLWEIGVTVLLLVRSTRTLGMYCAIALMAAFISFLIWGLTHPESVGCACFGGSLPQGLSMDWEYRVGLMRDATLLLLAALWLVHTSGSRADKSAG